MKKLKLFFILLAMVSAMGIGIALNNSHPVSAVTCIDGITEVPDGNEEQCPVSTPGGACVGGNFLSFPKWYKYLPSQTYTDDASGREMCIPKIEGLSGIWKIVAAVIEMITRLATLIAIGFIVYGGITYTLSQGNPDKTKQALKTIINALVGLAITIIATALVSFIAGRFI